MYKSSRVWAYLALVCLFGSFVVFLSRTALWGIPLWLRTVQEEAIYDPDSFWNSDKLQWIHFGNQFASYCTLAAVLLCLAIAVILGFRERPQ